MTRRDQRTAGSAAASAAQRLPAERRLAGELTRIAEQDRDPRPPGWRLSPRAVRRFILGDSGLEIGRKFYGDDALVERTIVDLLGDRALILVGEPGTAKTMLSELLAAAISGDSTLVIQGTAGTTEDQVRYGWNYALLLAEGPTRRALIPSPLLTAMERGALVRFEEITRCPQEIQDGLVSVLSDKVLAIPELGAAGYVFAIKGFNLIATANLRDRGVNEMSSALKRRLNFETVSPIRDRRFECELVRREAGERLGEAGVSGQVAPDIVELLVQVFHDLRTGTALDGTRIERPTAVMSTAEAVSVTVAAGLEAHYLGDGRIDGAHLARHLQGTVLKGDAEDVRRVRHYLDVVVRPRAEQDRRWAAFLEEARRLVLP
ncbi:MAG: AAA domain-containing protein [Azospirillum sp.]|nr:AAA domain-containing protein [Azospirillum sp.]